MATLFPGVLTLPDLSNAVIVIAVTVAVLMVVISVWSARTR